MKIKRYGWIRDHIDIRDFKYSAIKPKAIALPPSIDLRTSCPPVVDQGDLGSCTANALAGAVGFIHTGFEASRLFIYFNERDIEGCVEWDSGAQLRDGIKTLAKDGVCPESEWPYNVSDFATRPVLQCYLDAKQELLSTYHRINDLIEMKTCLAEGYPFVFGFVVFSEFEGSSVKDTGIVPMPNMDANPLGGHAVMAVGYDDAKNSLIVRNSWGSDWGIGGYFYLPYDYVTQGLTRDAWTLRS